MLALRLVPMYEEQGRKQMARAVAEANRQRAEQNPGEAELPHLGSKVRAPLSRDKAAAVTGASGRAVAQAKRVVEKAPDLAEKVRAPLSRDKAAAVTGACGRRWRTARCRSAGGTQGRPHFRNLALLRTPTGQRCLRQVHREPWRLNGSRCSPATYPTLSPGLLPAPTSVRPSSTPVPPGTTDRYRFCRR